MMSAQVPPSDVVDRLVATHIAPHGKPSDVGAFASWARENRLSIIFVDLTCADQARVALSGCATQIGVPCAHPTGFLSTDTKVAFINAASQGEVDEIDMGVSIDHLRDGRFDQVTSEVRELVDASDHAIRVVFTVDLPLLRESSVLKGCEAIARGGAEAICTAWGYGVRTDVSLIRQLVTRFGEDLQIEASGGIRTLAVVRDMLASGAYRVHSGKPAAILKEVSGE